MTIELTELRAEIEALKARVVDLEGHATVMNQGMLSLAAGGAKSLANQRELLRLAQQNNAMSRQNIKTLKAMPPPDAGEEWKRR